MSEFSVHVAAAQHFYIIFMYAIEKYDQKNAFVLMSDATSQLNILIFVPNAI